MLQPALVADPEQRRQLHNTNVHSESSSSKAASASDVTSSAANTFRLACAEPSELHQAVGMLPGRTDPDTRDRSTGRLGLGFDCVSKGSSGSG